MLEFLQTIGHALESAVGWVFSSNWLPPTDFVFYKWLVVPGFGYGFILIGLGLAELIIPQDRRPWGRASLLSATYLLFAGKLGIYAFIVTPAIRKVWLYLGIPSLRLDEHLPLPVYIPVAVLVVTFTAYWAHRLMHRIPILWHIHKIHHSAVNLNYSTVYHKHFLETLLQTPLHVIAVLALGTNLVSPFGIIFKFIDVFGHANVRIPTGWFTYLISTPQAHRVHHSIDPQHYDTNFGNTFMWWDHIFGTFHYDPDAPPTAYGVTEKIPPSFVKQQIMPLVWIGRDLKAGLSNALLRPRPDRGVDGADILGRTAMPQGETVPDRGSDVR
jgi:sterol desaturase/sphingolipid hydroxylase (fatty acid hydroxylase superfamily)